MKKTLSLSAIAVIISLTLVACQISNPEASIIPLPEGLEKLSRCIPNMGEHHANPDDLPKGPIYLVDKGKVVGIEYTVHEEDLEGIIRDNGHHRSGEPTIMSALGMNVDHVQLNYLPDGMEGDEEARYDVHLFLVSEEERQQLCQS